MGCPGEGGPQEDAQGAGVVRGSGEVGAGNADRALWLEAVDGQSSQCASVNMTVDKGSRKGTARG